MTTSNSISRYASLFAHLLSVLLSSVALMEHLKFILTALFGIRMSQVMIDIHCFYSFSEIALAVHAASE